MDTTTIAIDSVVLEAADVAAAEAFYAALGLADRVRVRPDGSASSGFRGYTLSLVVAHPGTVRAYFEAALAAGADALKQPKASLWGFGASVRAPDGSVWTIASSSKKAPAGGEPAPLEYGDLVLLLGVGDVKASKEFYMDRGLKVAKSFGGKYAEFETSGSGLKLALNPRRLAAKNAGVDPEGSGSHRIAVVGNAGAFTDPDGFVWEDPAAGA